MTLSDYEPLLHLIHRLCVFDGKNVDIQAKSWKPSKEAAPDYAVKFNAEQGGLPRKAFQRGEIIPLLMDVFGNKYAGQEIKIHLRSGADVVWEKTYPASKLKAFSTKECIDTTLFRCGEYLFEGSVDGQKAGQEQIWVCPERRNNSFPLLVGKSYRKNLVREDLALKYIRDNSVNVMIYDMLEFKNAGADPVKAGVLGNYLDLILRNNLMANARVNALNLSANNQDEKLVLYDGANHKHGVDFDALSWRGFLAGGHLDDYREGLRNQVSLLRGSNSPVILPFFFTNDDGSMGGNYDFSPATMEEFQKKTRLTRKDLPPLEKMKTGNSVFMPVVPPGIIDDKDPWLQYFRYHCGKYNRIAQAAMEGVESGWPGSLLADIGCGAGALYIPRGFYPPLSSKSYNAASFYQYHFWSHQYPFSIEASLMNNRGKPVGLIMSASLIAWGPEFQRCMLYRILAEAPKFIGLFHLDDRKLSKYEKEEETWRGYQGCRGEGRQSSRISKAAEDHA